MTPCMECGNIPFASCMIPPYGYNQGYGQLQVQHPNTVCEECASRNDPPCAALPDGNYQEIGASMGGNSLTIRVHKDKNQVEQMDPNCPYTPAPPPDDGCSCIPGRPGKKSKQVRHFQ